MRYKRELQHRCHQQSLDRHEQQRNYGLLQLFGRFFPGVRNLQQPDHAAETGHYDHR